VTWRAVLGGLLSIFMLTAATDPEAAEGWGPITVVHKTVAPGTGVKFPFTEERSFRASFLNTAIFVARGSSPGPTLCLTAGIHGDELNGVEVARKSFASVDPQQLRGTVIAVPAINMEGVRTGSRYLTDRRDLNRSFPGREGGSIASLIAYAVTSAILPHCDFVVDLHTGSDSRSNVPQIRADLDNEAIRELALHFGQGIIVGGAGPEGSWRREAANAGVPAIIYEAGEPLRFEPAEIDHGVSGVRSVMAYLKMIDAPTRTVPEEKVYTRSKWIRASIEQNGFFFPVAALGDEVREGDLLGRIVDPVSDFEHEIRSTTNGALIGMAVARPVLGGYGLFHIAWAE
jgi:predicted deacylase